MGDMNEEPTAAPEPPEMIEVTVRVPARVLADYDAEVGAGIYENRGEALRQGLTESWRFHRGRYSTLRIDLRDPEDRRLDTDPVSVDEALAAADALTDTDGEPTASEGDSEDRHKPEGDES